MAFWFGRYIPARVSISDQLREPPAFFLLRGSGFSFASIPKIANTRREAALHVYNFLPVTNITLIESIEKIERH
jgi:hypothetical protein